MNNIIKGIVAFGGGLLIAFGTFTLSGWAEAPTLNMNHSVSEASGLFSN